MRRFRFSLESVLTVRQKTLEDERIRLASIMNVLNKQNEVLAQMNYSLAQLEKESERFLNFEGFNPELIANYHSYSNKLIQDIKVQEQIIEKTKIDLEKQQEIAKQAYIKVKSLENLKEKQKEQYNKEFLLEEIKITDDIVSSRKTA